MTKLIMMVGLPGAGKSTVSKEIAERENAVILSADALKDELLNGANDEKYNPMIFHELYTRAQNNIRNGKSVVLDATNAGSETRIDALKKYDACEKECYYINTPLEVCLERNSRRQRMVSEDLIVSMYTRLMLPSTTEGFDRVFVWNKTTDLKTLKEEFGTLLKTEQPYEYLFQKQTVLHHFTEIREMLKLAEEFEGYDMPIHKYIHQVYEQMLKKHPEEDRYVLRVAALLYGIGKPFCITFDKESPYETYTGYERVSAQMALNLLIRMGYPAEFCLKLCHIMLHQEEGAVAL